MAESTGISRRRAVAGAAAGAGALLLGGCDKIEGSAAVKNVLARSERLTRRAQALLSPRDTLAREYSEADISPEFRGNGTVNPDTEDYQDMAANNFADWRLEVGGLVEHPMRLSLEEVRALPSRTQITRHDCVEGWSCIGKWKGAVLGPLLRQAGLRHEARYIVFYCADPPEGGDPNARYYESIDLSEAFHPQTILAYEMNNAPLTVRHGAPVRLRVERQLGYKMAKYVMRIDAVDSFAGVGGGKGGFWEDQGYAWYAGI